MEFAPLQDEDPDEAATATVLATFDRTDHGDGAGVGNGKRANVDDDRVAGHAAMMDAMNQSLERPSRWPKRTTAAVCAVSLIGGVICIVLPLLLLPSGSLESTHLSNFVTVAGVVTLLEEFQTLGSSYAYGSRAAGRGCDAMASYISTVLQQNNYWPEETQVQLALYSVVGTPTLAAILPGGQAVNYTYGRHFNVATYSASGSVAGAAVVLANVNPCNGGAIPTGSGIAVLQRPPVERNTTTGRVHSGNCALAAQASAAAAAGYSAVILASPAPFSFAATLHTASTIPVLLASSEVISQLSVVSSAVLQLSVTGTVTSYTAARGPGWPASNLCVDHERGDASNTILVVASLDSPVAGPGINRMGSGAAAALELAIGLQVMGLEATNRIRFCWVVGDEANYVGILAMQASAATSVAVALDLDTLASPNFVRGIYNGTSFSASTAVGGTYVQQLFASYFDSANLPYVVVPYATNTDRAILAEAGVTTGGLFVRSKAAETVGPLERGTELMDVGPEHGVHPTGCAPAQTGATGIKSDQDHSLFGGVINAPYDPCSDEACDTAINIDVDVLQDNLAALATVLQELATDSSVRTHLTSAVA